MLPGPHSLCETALGLIYGFSADRESLEEISLLEIIVPKASGHLSLSERAGHVRLVLADGINKWFPYFVGEESYCCALWGQPTKPLFSHRLIHPVELRPEQTELY